MTQHNDSGELNTHQSKIPFERFQAEVITPGLCTHCGTCVGLSAGQLTFARTEWGPLPSAKKMDDQVWLPRAAWQACPGRGLDYPQLCNSHFGRAPDSWLTGPVIASYLGYSKNELIRRQGASGGVMTHLLAALVERGELDGAVVLQHGQPEPWLSRPIISRDPHQILASSQSVYIPIPVNTILEEVEQFEGSLGFVGLPDQVASIRRLQALDNPAANKIRLVLGPYVGTSMYHSALSSYLRSHGGYTLDDVAELRYREGEWPGHLMIRTKDGRQLRAEKFYYNYLIPFFITNSCLLTMDFTNELTDISVGDAWSPELEKLGEGFSVILARSAPAQQLLETLAVEGLLALEPIELERAISMHGHMLDFKKRGAYIRVQFRKAFGQAVPNFRLRPLNIGRIRYLIEVFIFLLFMFGRNSLIRWLMEKVPSSVLGPIFERFRRAWKGLSKPVKREGIWDLEFAVENHGETDGN